MADSLRVALVFRAVPVDDVGIAFYAAENLFFQLVADIILRRRGGSNRSCGVSGCERGLVVLGALGVAFGGHGPWSAIRKSLTGGKEL